MEKIEGTEMNGDNWYVKRDPLNAKIFIVKTITIWGDEFKRVDSLIEAMNIVKKFKNQEDWILEKRKEFGEFIRIDEDFRKDLTSGT